MQHVPLWVDILFISSVLLATGIFIKAMPRGTRGWIFVLIVWGGLQTTASLAGFYGDTYAVPPRFPLLIAPALVGMAILFLTPGGRRFIDGIDPRTLTLLHVVRIPVEITLYCLFVAKAIPEIMTFEGYNFDMAAGITAPLVYYIVFVKKWAGPRFLLIWNLCCLLLLSNIVGTAILSAPTPIQKLAFDQPNIAITHFPYILLPAVVVPLVMFSHLAMIRQLVRKKN